MYAILIPHLDGGQQPTTSTSAVWRMERRRHTFAPKNYRMANKVSLSSCKWSPCMCEPRGHN
ncbi:hypothetical protein PAXRUDRAFT_823670 [Paxillus rubicundulus Ve08.2h10]|uniref:Uncharacterized protein n=1 Tax=Paxillus rubicundulus Ve08.2h10 TaxID=930991 RepID=A0A0D0EC24_9AGAM|nr:hypothetical protein PAXRUDRAFT_823670 [Paxillus rubicundulus Ve08.2h10]